MDSELKQAWLGVESELGHWQRAGRVATLWWRDDDAAAPTPALLQGRARD